MNICSAYEDHNKMWMNLFKEVKNFETEWSAAAIGSLESTNVLPSSSAMVNPTAAAAAISERQ